MRAGREAARQAGVEIRRGEHTTPLGDRWLIRHRKGFAPCPWAFDLAHFSAPRPGDRVLDLGCGGGVLLCAVAQVQPAIRGLVGLELDPAAADQARRNLTLNGLKSIVVQGDVRRIPLAPRAFNLVLSNPPFYRAGWGRQSQNHATARATHALHGDVADFAQAAATALSVHGVAVFVYDAGHLAALLIALGAAGLTIRRVRFLDDDRGVPARVLVAAGHGGGGVVPERIPYDKPRRD